MGTQAMDVKLPQIRSEFRHLKVGDLAVHPDIQRPFDEAWRDHIVANFKKSMMHPLAVVPSGRQRPTHLIIDGQHLFSAAQKALGLRPEQLLSCQVFYVAGNSEAAQLSRILNDQKRWRAIDEFKRELTGKDPVVLDINNTIEAHGLAIGGGAKSAGMVPAVAALKWIWNLDEGAMLARVLGVLTDAWQKDPDAYCSVMLRGLANMLRRWGKEINDSELARRLSKTGPPRRVIGDARTLAKVHRISVVAGVTLRLTQEYNVRRKSGKLQGILKD